MNRSARSAASSDHVIGSADAPVTLLEYGDYECPHCRRAHFVVDSVLGRIGDRMRYVFRTFPLSETHPHALLAAQSAEAAGAQGKFWPMHATLFENQPALEIEDMVGYAEALDLDVQRMLDELRAGFHLAKVRADFRSGVRSGVNGTPTFFVNGLRFDGSWDPDSLVLAIRKASEEAARLHA